MMHERPTPHPDDGRVSPTTGAPAPSSAFGRAYQRNRTLLPESHSVAAFITWMRALGFKGEILQEELFLDYVQTSEMMGERPLPLKRFGRALRTAGFPPYQTDLTKPDGTRSRPMAVNLSAVKPDLAVVAGNVAVLARATTSAKAAKTPRIGVLKAA